MSYAVQLPAFCCSAISLFERSLCGRLSHAWSPGLVTVEVLVLNSIIAMSFNEFKYFSLLSDHNWLHFVMHVPSKSSTRITALQRRGQAEVRVTVYSIANCRRNRGQNLTVKTEAFLPKTPQKFSTFTPEQVMGLHHF